MSIKGGPKIETDGLVLYYDVDNIDSYPGEPTTNIATSQTMFSHNGHGVMTFSDAPERGTDWKKVNITHRGNDFRITQMPYNTQPDGTTHAFSIEIDWGTTSGYYVQGDGSTGFSITGNTSDWPHGTYTNSSGGNRVEALFLYNQTYDVDVDDTIYYRYYQVEVKSHSTPYTSGTRSTTNGLKDLSGQGNHGDLANATYDSSALIDYDGSTSSVDCGNASSLNVTSITVTAWIYPNTISEKVVLDKQYSTAWEFGIYNGYNVHVNAKEGGTYYSHLMNAGGGVIQSAWNYIVWSYDETTGINRTYANGVLTNEITKSGVLSTNASNCKIGSRGASLQFDGKIDLVQIYDNALTSKEILDNYNAQKSRFGK